MNFLLRRSGIVLTSLLFATAFAPSFDPLLAQTPHVLKGATEHAAQPSALIAIPAKLPDQDSADDRPCFTLDGRQMYFGSRRASKDAWRAPDNSIFKDPSWKWDGDLWYRVLTDSGWSIPINIGPPINNSGAQINPTISPRGDELYYVGGGAGATLWRAKLIDGKWQQPQPVPGLLNRIYAVKAQAMEFFRDSILQVVKKEMIPDSDLKLRAPDAYDLHFRERVVDHLKTQMAADFFRQFERCESTISPDGEAAIFSENFGQRGAYGMDGEGGDDLWLVKISPSGSWDSVYRIDHVNSAYDESYPFIAADGETLYFTSNRPCPTCGPGTSGQQDIYRTQWTGRRWTDPVPLGPPFNSPADDYGFSIGPDGKTAYFMSNREGKSRLYQVDLRPEDSAIAPKPVVILQGIVTDAKTHKPLEAQIFVDDLTAEANEFSVTTDSISGAYALAAKRGHRFGIQAIASGHLPHSERFTVPAREAFDRTKLDLELEPVGLGASMEFKNVSFGFGKADLLPESKLELDRVVEFLRKSANISLEIGGYTDDVGSNAANQTLSEERARAVRDYLVSRGIPAVRLKAVGYGKSKPLVKGTSEEARAKNRRVEMTITSETN